MNTSLLITCAPLLVLLAWAAVVDYRERRIPNWLTFGLALGGLAQCLTPAPAASLGASALGLLVGFGLTFILFGIGARGGGDVKAMAAVGAWIGPLPVLQVFAASAVMSMLLILGQAMIQGRMRKLLRNSAVVAMTLAHANEVGLDQAVATGQSCAGSIDRPLPHAIPLLAAVVMAFWMGWVG